MWELGFGRIGLQYSKILPYTHSYAADRLLKLHQTHSTNQQDNTRPTMSNINITKLSLVMVREHSHTHNQFGPITDADTKVQMQLIMYRKVDWSMDVITCLMTAID